MTDTSVAAVPPPAEPDGAPRVPVLDVMRGVAILAILFMNVPDMGNSAFRANGGEPWQLGWTLADRIAWWLRELFATGTARGLLEMLFGVGMVILTDRAAIATGKWRVMAQYQWRNIVLFVFGLIHVFILLWPGDILHTYGLAALIAVLFRRWRARWLIAAGLVFAMLQLVGGTIGYAYMAQSRATAAAIEERIDAQHQVSPAERKTLEDYRKQRAKSAERRAEMAGLALAEDRARTGSAASWAKAAWDEFIWLESRFLEIAWVWEALSAMLIGAALYRLGIIQGGRSRRLYLTMAAIGYAMGCALRGWAGWSHVSFPHQPSFAEPFGEVARLLVTLGHVGLVNFVMLGAVGARALRPFAAAGKTALSIYVAQTLICLWVIYPPWGLALYGRQGWAAMMATALVVDALLLLAAMWWTRRFRIAPVEWAWRSIVARRRLGFRHHPSHAIG